MGVRVYYEPFSKLARPFEPGRVPFRFAGVSRETVGTGTVTLDFGMPPVGWQWLIERMNISGLGSCIVYAGGVDATGQVDVSSSGLNVADEASPIQVYDGMHLTVVFSGVPASTRCVATIQGVCAPMR